MQINAKDIKFGQPILKIREVVRYAMQGKLHGNNLQEIETKVAALLKQSITVAIDVVKQMIQAEYIVINKKESFGDVKFILDVTESARRFGVAKANPPISRQKATHLLDELIKRAVSINEDAELGYCVESIKVFGSYLSEKEILGDLDVAVKISPKYVGEKFTEVNQSRIDMAILEGRQFRSFIDELFWPSREVWLMLKARKRGLSLIDEERDAVVEATETRIVYKFNLNRDDLNNNNKTQS